MKAKMILGAALLGLALVTSQPAFAKETSAADIRLLEDKFRKLDGADEKATLALVASASNAVKAMPHSNDNKLDQLQVKELVELLRVSAKHDSFNRIVDDNSELITANRKAIGQELKKLSPAEAKQIGETIQIVAAGDEQSDYIAGSLEKAPTKKASKK